MIEDRIDNMSSNDIDYDNVEVKLHPMLEAFLDANSYESKLDIFYRMREIADKDMLRIVALSIDVEVTKESIEDMYDEILFCLRTMEKFECNRLRS